MPSQPPPLLLLLLLLLLLHRRLERSSSSFFAFSLSPSLLHRLLVPDSPFSRTLAFVSRGSHLEQQYCPPWKSDEQQGLTGALLLAHPSLFLSPFGHTVLVRALASSRSLQRSSLVPVPRRPVSTATKMPPLLYYSALRYPSRDTATLPLPLAAAPRSDDRCVVTAERRPAPTGQNRYTVYARFPSLRTPTNLLSPPWTYSFELASRRNGVPRW